MRWNLSENILKTLHYQLFSQNETDKVIISAGITSEFRIKSYIFQFLH
jgi:hypothetical protein